MKLHMAVTLYSNHELRMLDYGLESIFDKTKNDIDATLYLARYTDELFDECSKLVEKYNINFEVRGDNSLLYYNNELRHKAFDIENSECALTIQPDTVFLKKNVFDSIVDEASQHFDSKYLVCVSSDHPDDSTPLGLVFHTKLGWEKVGCDDVNFYPQAGCEHDYHRRCYLKFGLDPENELYIEALNGKIDTPWAHRIRCKDFMHVGKSWHRIDPRLEQPRRINYSLQILFENILQDRWAPYYMEKWGGWHMNERFIHPFNNENNSLRIPWENNLNPYPESRYINLKGLVL